MRGRHGIADCPRIVPDSVLLAPRFPHTLLDQIGFKLACGIFKVAPGDDVVALENGPRFVARDRHGYTLGNAGAHEIADPCPPEIVEEESLLRVWRACSRLPSFVEAADVLAISGEDKFRIGILRARFLAVH